MSVELFIDPRIHNRLIGTKGRTVRKYMDQYKVDIRFPRGKPDDPVVITGLAPDVEEAKEQLELLEEEYVSIFLFIYSFVLPLFTRLFILLFIYFPFIYYSFFSSLSCIHSFLHAAIFIHPSI